jgi:hypothetical protein
VQRSAFVEIMTTATSFLLPTHAMKAILGRGVLDVQNVWAKAMTSPTVKNRGNRRRCIFRGRDVRRAIRALRSEGLNVTGVEVDSVTGKIVVHTGTSAQMDDSEQVFHNPWDSVPSHPPPRRKRR